MNDESQDPRALERAREVGAHQGYVAPRAEEIDTSVSGAETAAGIGRSQPAA